MSVNGFEVTEIRVNPFTKKDPGSPLEAFARVILNGELCIDSIRILKGKFGLFIAFPQRYDREEGKGFDLCYPITKALRSHISERVLDQWKTVRAVAA